MSILPGWLKEKCYKKTDTGYKLTSRDTSSETLYFNDSKTAQTKLGTINGISSSSTATANDVAASIGYVNESVTEINSNMVENIYVGTDGKLHKVQGGADTVLPFSSKPKILYWTTGTVNVAKDLPDVYKQLTTADFIVGTNGSRGYALQKGNSGDAHNGANVTKYSTVTCSYDNNSGLLTVNTPVASGMSSTSGYGAYVEAQNTGTPIVVYRGTIAGKTVD